MAKGKLKRRASGSMFQLNHKKLQAYRKADEDRVQSGSSSAATSNTSDQSAIEDKRPSLRANQDLKQEGNCGEMGNRIMDLNLLIAMMNGISAKHSLFSEKCRSLNVCLIGEQKLGLGSKLQFKCNNCQFTTERYRTYQTCANSRGAAINMMLASALMDMPIGISKANLLFSSLDIQHTVPAATCKS